VSSQLYIHYGGIAYMLVDREPDEVRQELHDALRQGEPYWLEANYGEGRPSTAHLLIMPGVPLALRYDPDPAP
jgi:hypothetical protein